MIKTEITEATTSMTSVPKPLKFLTPQYSKLVAAYKNYTGTDSFKVSSHQYGEVLINFLFTEKPFRSLLSDRHGGCGG